MYQANIRQGSHQTKSRGMVAGTVINNGEVGPVARHLFQQLTDIQYGRIPDPFGWTYSIYSNGH